MYILNETFDSGSGVILKGFSKGCKNVNVYQKIVPNRKFPLWSWLNICVLYFVQTCQTII